MQSIRPQNLTDRELLNHAYMVGYDKLPEEWAVELAKRLEAWVSGDERSIVADDGTYQRGYDAGYNEGYDEGYAQGSDNSADDGK